MNNTIIFDIETGPLPDMFLDLIAPQFEAPSNYKDEAKIAAHIAEQKVKWKERAALDPLTGKVLAIGVRDLAGEFLCMDGEGSEEKLLQDFTTLVTANHSKHFVGFNIFGFDVPFLVRRAWKMGVKPCMRPGANFRYVENWTDLYEVWKCGDRTESASLDTFCKFLGLPGKSGSGKDFARIWKEDRPAALSYLQTDITQTYEVALRMGIIV